MQTSAQSSFRQRLVSGAFLAGSFVKTPSPHATEILGNSGFDFIVVDQEHAPFDRVTTDLVLLAARAAGVAGVVRVPTLTSDAIQASLDCGAVGILAPHVANLALLQGQVTVVHRYTIDVVAKARLPFCCLALFL